MSKGPALSSALSISINAALIVFLLSTLPFILYSSCSSRAEDSTTAMSSRLNIRNRTGKEVPVTTAPIRRGAMRKIMKNFRTIVNLSYYY